MFRYHLAQSVGLVSAWAVIWLVAAWLIGEFPFLPQVAWAAQIDAQSSKIDTVSRENARILNKLTDIELLGIRNSIEQQLKTSCLALRSHNQDDLDSANQQLSQLTDQYYQMSGRTATLPSCATILVESK